ncbi:MAG: methyltransferase domain-containing protein [Myxococcales bacterium]
MYTVERDDDLLRCRGCARTYPVLDGIPVLFKDLAQTDTLGFFTPLNQPEALAAIAAAGPDGAPLPHLVEQLSSYLPAWESGFEGLAQKLRDRPPVDLALEIGCGVGRGLFELSRNANAVVGLDRSGSFLRAARTLLSGQDLPYARRMSGRSYVRASVRAPSAVTNVQLVCGDALDPPFAPEQFQRVVAFNVLDSVRSPRALLHHIHQLATPRAEILLASPYAWRDDVVPVAERLGTSDPATALREEIRTLGWSIKEEAEVPWTLRRDARALSLYQTHFVRCLKAEA